MTRKTTPPKPTPPTPTPPAPPTLPTSGGSFALDTPTGELTQLNPPAIDKQLDPQNSKGDSK